MVNKADTIAGGMLFAVSAGYAYLILTLPNRNLPNTVGASFMPTVFDICLAVLSLLLIGQSIWRNKTKGGAKGAVPISGKGILAIVAVFAMFFAYILLIDVVGFVVVTPIVILGLLLLQGIRKPVALISVSIGVTVGVYLLFQYGFNVQLTAFNLP